MRRMPFFIRLTFQFKKEIEPRRRKEREGLFCPNRVHQPIRRRLVLRFEQNAHALRATDSVFQEQIGALITSDRYRLRNGAK
jgi:hypothetical protein